MADVSKSILEQIKEQGEVVRKLKAEKASADLVCCTLAFSLELPFLVGLQNSLLH